MSQVYSTEPQTAGRVIFETTHGPLEIQLWCRECPSTTKHFLQLCLDGYYDNVIFHRIVPNFLIQTGALRYNPTSQRASQLPPVTSMDANVKDLQRYRQKVQADAALERRQYELNTRIRFNHRGQVAMALGIESEGMGEDEMALMQPQFFITLDEASELDGKHVCFGTITGPTIFNALRIGNTDVDEDGTNQPSILHEAPRIERVKILENPIHSDIVLSSGVMPWKITISDGEDDPKKKRKKRKGIKNVNVLSFGDEMEKDFDGGTGIKSSHDVIETKKFSKKVDKRLEDVIRGNVDKSLCENIPSSEPPNQKIIGDQESAVLPLQNSMIPSSSPAIDDEALKPNVMYQAHSERKRRKEDENPIVTKEDEVTLQHREKPPKVSVVEARRAKYAKASAKDKRKREDDTMAKFLAFQTKVTLKRVKQDDPTTNEDTGIAARMARRSQKEKDEEKGDRYLEEAVPYHGQILDNDDDAGEDWMKTKFKCKKHQDLDAKLGGDGRDAMEDYVVVDEKDRGTHGRKGHKHRHHQTSDSFSKRETRHES